MAETEKPRRLYKPYVPASLQGCNGTMTPGLFSPPVNWASQKLSSETTPHTETACHMSLPVLIHVTCQQFNHFRDPSWLPFEYSVILEAASKFNAQDTSLELQHEFCALWNQVVLQAQNDDPNGRWMASKILGPIRDVHVAIHQDTDAAPTRFSTSTSLLDDILFDPTSYPLCDIAGHYPDPTHHIHKVFTSMTFPRAAFHHDVVLPPASLSSALDAPSSFIPTPLHISENLAYVLSLDDNMSVPASLQPAYQSTIESLHIPVASLPDVDTSGITITYPAPETSPSASPFPSTSPPAAAAALRPDLRAPSDALNLPSSTSNPVLDDIFPTGLPLSSRSPVTPSDLSLSYLESHRTMTVTVPGASPEPASAPDLPAAAAEDNGRPEPGLRKK
ncbi:hypothetical protein H4582DRAFT_945368 [Lactarius indigo]|nr:hypothetical protein H4582DRAFT_945368 [Lactarius indigo]